VAVALAARSARLRPIAERLRALDQAGRLASSLQSIVGSFVHMSANRLFRSSARAQELVLYDFILRATRSRQARRSSAAARAAASS
jgi:thiopeptide-type bacteriocin biosynthesis protein